MWLIYIYNVLKDTWNSRHYVLQISVGTYLKVVQNRYWRKPHICKTVFFILWYSITVHCSGFFFLICIYIYIPVIYFFFEFAKGIFKSSKSLLKDGLILLSYVLATHHLCNFSDNLWWLKRSSIYRLKIKVVDNIILSPQLFDQTCNSIEKHEK